MYGARRLSLLRHFVHSILAGRNAGKNEGRKKRVKTPLAILAELAAEPTITLKQVAMRIGKSTSIVERAVAVLVKDGRLRFVGPRKSGRWEVLDPDA
ncbi:MAG: winged helix-turn-helix domain-containing protein [Aeromonas veronii]